MLDIYEQLSPDIADFPEQFGTFDGKFVQAGPLVMVTPFSTTDRGLYTTHTLLLEAALGFIARDDRLIDEEPPTNIRTLLRDRSTGRPTILHDAGYFNLRHSAGSLTAVRLESLSARYGRANSNEREYTGRQFSRILGDKVEIIVR